VKPDLEKLLPGIARIQQLLPRVDPRLIAIDGGGAAGKSEFASLLVSLLPPPVAIVQMDDFYLPSEQRRERSTELVVGRNFDLDRLEAQVLEPLRSNHEARYQRYDWPSDRLAEWKIVQPHGTILVEGVYSSCERFRSLYHLRVWVECDEATRLDRGIKRDGEHAISNWINEWLPDERFYFKNQRPREHADIIIDTSGRPDAA
jgi:uridine kinase